MLCATYQCAIRKSRLRVSPLWGASQWLVKQRLGLPQVCRVKYSLLDCLPLRAELKQSSREAKGRNRYVCRNGYRNGFETVVCCTIHAVTRLATPSTFTRTAAAGGNGKSC